MRAGRRYRSGRLQLHPVCLAKGSRVAGTSNVEWLLREAMDERALRISERAVVDNDSWRATIERLQIGPGLRVFLTDVQAHQDVTVEARDDRTDQWMGSQVTIAGRADIDFLDGQRTFASADHAVLFRSPGRRAAYTVKAGARFQGCGRYAADMEIHFDDVIGGSESADFLRWLALQMRDTNWSDTGSRGLMIEKIKDKLEAQ